MLKKYTNDILAVSLQEKARALGRTPTSEDVDADPDMPSYATYRLRFGSFPNAIRKAGLKPVARHYVQHSKDDLLNMLREMAKTLGHTPTSREIDLCPTMPSSHTFRYHFGSLENAIREAKLAQNEIRASNRYTKEDLLSMLKEKTKQLGRVPTQDELNSDPSMPNYLTYVYHFGSFRLACEEAGMLYRERGVPIKYTDPELLDLLKQKAKQLGGRPLGRDLGNKNNMPSKQLYNNRFGGLRNALKKAGIL